MTKANRVVTYLGASLLGKDDTWIAARRNEGYGGFGTTDPPASIQAQNLGPRLASQGIEWYYNRSTGRTDPGPTAVFIAPWYNDSRWTSECSAIQADAAATASAGGVGHVFDLEVFPNNDGLFSYSYSPMCSGAPGGLGGGNALELNTKAQARGQQYGAAIAAGNNNTKILMYLASGANTPLSLFENEYAGIVNPAFGGQPELTSPTHNWSTFWPWLCGFIKGLCTGTNCTFGFIDAIHYHYSDPPRRAQKMLYGNYTWFASLSRGMGAVDYLAVADRVHYHPFVWVDEEFSGLGPGPTGRAFTPAQLFATLTDTRDYACDSRSVIFQLGDGTWGGGYPSGFNLAPSIPALQACATPAPPSTAPSGDNAPTLTLTSAPSGATVTGQATGHRGGVRKVFAQLGGTIIGATMRVIDADTNGIPAAAGGGYFDSPRNWRVDFTLAAVPVGASITVVDGHGGTFTLAQVAGSIASLEANDTMTATGLRGHTGTIATAEGNDTAAIVGARGVAGTIATAEANDTTAIVGAHGRTGSITAAEGNDTTAIVGAHGVAGSIASLEANDTMTAAGSALPPPPPPTAAPSSQTIRHHLQLVYPRDAESPAIELTILDDTDAPLDLSGAALALTAGALTKTAGLYGTNTRPNVLIVWNPGELAQLPRGVYPLALTATFPGARDRVFPGTIAII